MRWKCSSSQQPAFSAQYERSWRVLPVSRGVPGAIFERARLFCGRAGIEPARVRVCRLSALPSFYAASMSPSSFSSSHVSSFRADFEAACGRSVPTTVSPDERSEELPKAMSIRGAASNRQPVKCGFTSASHWTLRCWLLAAEAFRSEATPEGAEGVSGLVAVRVEACARRGRRVAACRIAGTAVDGRQEHQHRVRPHAGQNHRSVGSMPTHKKTVGRARWGVPGGGGQRCA